jgi:GNAT superfamily N-acetyltransferase
MTSVELRPANDDDRELIFDAFKATLQKYVAWAWGWDEDFQRKGFWQQQAADEFRVITVNGKIAGGIRTEVQESLHFVRLIFLLPDFQRQGIGTQLILAEAARASRANKQLHLKVIKINPAQTLYERIGFVVVSEDAATIHMRLPDKREHLSIESTA